MKTKLLLTTVCLPALFAACTADEFVDQQQVKLNRETINLTLINSGLNFGSPETRMGATEGTDGSLTYKWIDTDKLGAAVLDGKVLGTLNDDNTATFNYAFNRTSNETEGSKFTAASPVMKGLYLFYHKYTGSVNRETVKLSVEKDQVFNPDLTMSAADQMAQYVKGISPVVDLSATGITQDKAADLQLPVKFANLGVPVKFVIKANSLPGSGAKLERIVISKTDNSNIALGGVIDFDALSNSNNVGNKVTVTANSTDEELVTAFDAQRAKVIDLVNGGTVFTSANKVESASVSVTVKGNDNAGAALSETEGKVVYLVMPNNSTSTKYTVKIQTSEGYYEKDADLLFASAGGETEVAGAGVKTLNITLNFDSNTGNIKQPTTFNIPQDYTWAAALKYINSHPKLYLTQEVEFNLTDNAEITSEEKDYSAFQDLNIKLTSNSKSLTAGSGIIGNVNSSRWKFMDAASIIVPEGKDLTIQSLGDLSAQDVTITNNGTLTLNGVADATHLKVINNSVLKLNAVTEVHTLTNSGIVLTNAQSLTVANTFANSGTNAAITVASGGTLALTAATMTNAATITNNGTLKLGVAPSTATTLTNTGIITNAGKIQSVGSAASKIENSGADAVINLENGGVSDGASNTEYSATSGNGKIIIKDIDDYSAIQTADEYNIAATSTVTTRVQNVAEYNKATGASAITNITLAAGTTWRFADSASGDVLAVPTQGITTEANVSIILANGLTIAQEFTSLTVEGANTVLKAVNNIGQPTETEESASAAVKITALTIGAAGKLTVNETVTVNEAKDSNAQTADIQGVLTVAGKMYFNTAEIGSATNSDAKLILTPKAQGGTAAEFGVKSTFNNYGTVEATKSGDQVRGNVSQASNKDNGKIVGEWGTISFPA